MTMNDVADALVHVVFAELAVFVVLYHARSRWRGTAIGRWVMALNVALLAIVALGLVAIHLTEWVARPSIRAGVWALVAGVIGWEVVLLWREQRAVRRGLVPRARAGSDRL